MKNCFFAIVMHKAFLTICWILAAYFTAWIVRCLAPRIARALLRAHCAAPHIPKLTAERFETLVMLISSLISFMAFSVATFVAAFHFVSLNTLVWVLGLISAGLGLAARPIISDLLTGIGFIFRDPFTVGEKVEILNIEGVIESINMRMTQLRSSTGELYITPNGEIRTVRNFSRGRFSSLTVTLAIKATDLQRALTILERLAKEAVSELPNLLEPWQIISTGGITRPEIELTLVAKARFGKAAQMRPRMLALIHDRLREEGIHIAGE